VVNSVSKPSTAEKGLFFNHRGRITRGQRLEVRGKTSNICFEKQKDPSPSFCVPCSSLAFSVYSVVNSVS